MTFYNNVFLRYWVYRIIFSLTMNDFRLYFIFVYFKVLCLVKLLTVWILPMRLRGNCLTFSFVPSGSCTLVNRSRGLIRFKFRFFGKTASELLLLLRTSSGNSCVVLSLIVMSAAIDDHSIDPLIHWEQEKPCLWEMRS